MKADKKEITGRQRNDEYSVWLMQTVTKEYILVSLSRLTMIDGSKFAVRLTLAASHSASDASPSMSSNASALAAAKPARICDRRVASHAGFNMRRFARLYGRGDCNH
jgi:hypothetical protein